MLIQARFPGSAVLEELDPGGHQGRRGEGFFDG